MSRIARLLKGEPAPISLDEARAAFVPADKAHIAAIRAVEDVVGRWPDGMRDRRLILTMSPSSIPFENESLDSSDRQKESRKNIRDFHAALEAEHSAARARDTAQRAVDDLEHAEKIAALGDGRGALRDALAALREVEGEQATAEAAYHKATETYYGSHGDIDRAEAAIETAKRDAAAVMMGTASPDTKSIAEARRDLQDAQDRKEVAKAARDGLEVTRTRLAQSRTIRAMDVDNAVRHVVSVSSETRDLCRAFEKATAEWLLLRDAIETLRSLNMLPESFDQVTLRNAYRPFERAPAWAGVAVALKSDPDAPLPKVG